MLTSLKDTKKGFTLIELLVVIAIIGILSSVVLASLSTARQKSRDAKRISDLGQIQLALELFFDANQSYPRTAHVASTATQDGGVIALTTAGFLPQTPVPPAGGSVKYFYRGRVSATNPPGAADECNLLAETCTSYLLAVTLERVDSTVLTTDADVDATAWVAHVVGALAQYGEGGDIAGLGIGCGAAAGTAQPGGTETCYDISP